MNTNSIFDDLQQNIGSDAIQQMSRQLGTDPDSTSKAVSLALPILLGALTRNASTPQGATDLDTALGDHDGSILDDLGGLFGQQGAAGGGDGGGIGGGIGAAILRHVLGSRRGPVEQGVGRATGMNPQQVAQLLAVLAPIVMAVLGRAKRKQGFGAQELPQVLARGKAEVEKQAPAMSGLGRILDMNNDGEIADDVARIGSTVLGGLFKPQ